jgi:ABC-type multidrug transport system permease subunit
MFLKKLFTTIKKNLQIIFNSKISLIMFIFGPIILMMVIGISLGNTNIGNIKAGIYIEKSTTDFSEVLLIKSGLLGIQSKIYEDLSLCKEEVMSGEIQVCIKIVEQESEYTIASLSYIPNKKDYYYDITLYVDFSKQRTVWGVLYSTNRLINELSEEIKTKKMEVFNENIDLILKSILENEKKIEKIEGEINSLEKGLNNLNEKRTSIINTLQKINQSLEGIVFYLNNSELNPELKEEIIFKVENIKTESNKINTNLRNENSKIDEEIIRLGLIKKELEKLKELINNVDEDASNLKGINLEKILNPIEVTTKSVENENIKSEGNPLEFIDYLFPTFFIMFLILSGIVIPTIFTIKERQSSSFIRNITSNTSGVSIFLGNFLTYFILIFIQSIILLAISTLLLNINLGSNLFSILIINTLLISTLVLIGMILGYLFDSLESAVASSITSSLVFIIFTSLITPIETIQPLIASIINTLPTTILENSLRQTLLFNLPLFLPKVKIISIIISYISLLIISVIAYRLTMEKEI